MRCLVLTQKLCALSLLALPLLALTTGLVERLPASDNLPPPISIQRSESETSPTPQPQAGNFAIPPAPEPPLGLTAVTDANPQAAESPVFEGCAGFRFDDEGLHASWCEDRLQFTSRTLAQFEGVSVAPGTPASPGGFTFPRVREYFILDVDERINVTTVLQSAYGPIGPLSNWKVLDTWLELRFRPELKLRGGHFRSPFLYEFHLLGEDKLISPERSVYNNTVSTERQTGVMLFGDVFDERLYYAMGLFNGPSHVYYDTNTSKDFIGMADYKPFLLQEAHPLQHLHLIYSLDFGNQSQQPPVASTYRIASEMDQSRYRDEPTKVSPVWLLFDSRAREQGSRVEMAGEALWFYRSFTFLGSVQGGYRHFAREGVAPQRVPFAGFQASTSYFLTGEAFTNRDDIRPLRDFRWQSPRSNPGAWEVYVRYAQLDVGRQLIDKQIALPLVSTNAVQTIDLGATWYLNRHSSCYFNWQHSIYESPVLNGSHKPADGYDVFMARYQLFF